MTQLNTTRLSIAESGESPGALGSGCDRTINRSAVRFDSPTVSLEPHGVEAKFPKWITSDGKYWIEYGNIVSVGFNGKVSFQEGPIVIRTAGPDYHFWIPHEDGEIRKFVDELRQRVRNYE